MDHMNQQDRAWTHKQGQAGVYQVASQLLLRGVNVFFPAVDLGADLITDSGVRVQVKITHHSARMSSAYPAGAYWFHFMKTGIRRGKRTVAVRNLAADCDVVVLWGIEDDKFWVVPACELADCHCLVLEGVCVGAYKRATRPDSRQRRIAAFENRWDLIASHDQLIHTSESVEEGVNS